MIKEEILIGLLEDVKFVMQTICVNELDGTNEKEIRRNNTLLNNTIYGIICSLKQRGFNNNSANEIYDLAKECIFDINNNYFDEYYTYKVDLFDTIDLYIKNLR